MSKMGVKDEKADKLPSSTKQHREFLKVEYVQLQLLRISRIREKIRGGSSSKTPTSTTFTTKAGMSLVGGIASSDIFDEKSMVELILEKMELFYDRKEYAKMRIASNGIREEFLQNQDVAHLNLKYQRLMKSLKEIEDDFRNLVINYDELIQAERDVEKIQILISKYILNIIVSFQLKDLVRLQTKMEIQMFVPNYSIILYPFLKKDTLYNWKTFVKFWNQNLPLKINQDLNEDGPDVQKWKDLKERFIQKTLWNLGGRQNMRIPIDTLMDILEISEDKLKNEIENSVKSNFLKGITIKDNFVIFNGI